jgi:Lon protease-like protein
MDLLPLFPLPNVVLFPNVFLPLHIFEPRYRTMVADALSGDRVLGMVLLRPGWEHDYEGRPPVFDIGCSGVITHVERLADGRYNIILRGLDRFRIAREEGGLSYRRAEIELIPEPALEGQQHHELRLQRERVGALLAATSESGHRDPALASAMTDGDMINALAQYLDLEPLEKQALLERRCLLQRAESLAELLEMKLLMARTPGLSPLAN